MRYWRELESKWEGDYFEIYKWYKGDNEDTPYLYSINSKTHRKIIALFSKFNDAEFYAIGLEGDIQDE